MGDVGRQAGGLVVGAGSRVGVDGGMGESAR